MVCAAGCRLVMRSYISGIHSWAPGEKPTRIAKPAGPELSPELLAAETGERPLALIHPQAPQGAASR
jgi:hypothetical protein